MCAHGAVNESFGGQHAAGVRWLNEAAARRLLPGSATLEVDTTGGRGLCGRILKVGTGGRFLVSRLFSAAQSF